MTASRNVSAVQQSLLNGRLFRGVRFIRCMACPPFSEGNNCPNAFSQHERIRPDQKGIEGRSGARYCESQCEGRATVLQRIKNHHGTDREKTKKLNHRVCIAQLLGRIRRKNYSYMTRVLIESCRFVSALQSAHEQSDDVRRRPLPFLLCSTILAGERKFHSTSVQVIEHHGQTEWPEYPVGKTTDPAHFSLVWE